jgi:hypothetical protein
VKHWEELVELWKLRDSSAERFRKDVDCAFSLTKIKILGRDH